MKKYEILRIIGDGTFGIVYEGRNKETNQKVAIKKLKQKYRTIEECISKIEVKVLQKLNHENIVQLKEVIKDKNDVVSYIFEYCDCNLFDFIENHREKKLIIPEQIIREIIFQIVKGIKYMHSKKYFHRDLKPENILVILNKYRLNNIVPNELIIKIADFGTSKEIPTNSNNVFPMTDYVCTRWYRAPECVFRGDIYDEKVDVWAIGCIMAELYKLTAIFPGEDEFDQINQIMKILGTPTRSKWPWGYYQADLYNIQLPVYYKKDFKKILGYISKEGINLLNEIFTFDSVKRPSCSQILNHPFFKMSIPKPIISINNSLRVSSRKKDRNINNTIDMNNNDKDTKSLSKKKCATLRINNESKKKRNNIEKNISNNYNRGDSNIIKNKNNNFILIKDIKKDSNNLINIKNYKINHYSDKNYNYTIKDSMAQNLSITNKKTKNVPQYVKLNEIKSGIVTKKIIQYKKIKEERKDEDKKPFDLSRIGKNGQNFFNIHDNKRFSLGKNNKQEERKDSRNKSLEASNAMGNTLPANKKTLSYYEENKLLKENKFFKNNKKVNTNHNIDSKSFNNSTSNHKNLANISSKNNKIQYSYTIKNNKPQNNGKSLINNFNRINTKVIYSGKNKERNSENNKSKYQNNHKFYVSNGSKYAIKYHKEDHKEDFNYTRYLINDNYDTYNNEESYNHKCICSIGRNFSQTKIVLQNQTSREMPDKPKNKKSFDANNKSVITPRNNFENDNTSTNNISSISPFKNKKNKVSSLFSSFVSNNNKGKYIIAKSQSLIKNNYSTGIDKNPIKIINIHGGNRRKKYIINSTSKKRKL